MGRRDDHLAVGSDRRRRRHCNVHVQEAHIDNDVPRSGGKELGNGLREPPSESPGIDVGDGRAKRAAEESGLSFGKMSPQPVARVDGLRPVIENIRDRDGLADGRRRS